MKKKKKFTINVEPTKTGYSAHFEDRESIVASTGASVPEVLKSLAEAYILYAGLSDAGVKPNSIRVVKGKHNPKSLEAVSGIWKGKDITLQSIRKKAWERVRKPAAKRKPLTKKK